ncbi:MAG: hypothetical protein K2X68_02180 [Novosphingobium sp.]|nr:hypothetical protein [Novosphingobium sp.]
MIEDCADQIFGVLRLIQSEIAEIKRQLAASGETMTRIERMLTEWPL